MQHGQNQETAFLTMQGLSVTFQGTARGRSGCNHWKFAGLDLPLGMRVCEWFSRCERAKSSLKVLYVSNIMVDEHSDRSRNALMSSYGR